MRPLQGTTAKWLLLATYAQIIFGNPAQILERCTPSSACFPPVTTTSRVATVTVESIVTLTHSCYTQTLTTKRLAGVSGCPTLTNCGPHADCIIVSTQAVNIPPKDAHCTSTPTTLLQGPCPTCQTGCSVSVTTAYITSTSAPFLATPPPILQTPPPVLHHRIPIPEPAPAPNPKAAPQAQPPCYTTVLNSDPIPTGVTQTVFPVTVTKTSSLSCKGCEIVTKFLNGFGPASQFRFTVTAVGTRTVSAWECL